MLQDFYSGRLDDQHGGSGVACSKVLSFTWFHQTVRLHVLQSAAANESPKTLLSHTNISASKKCETTRSLEVQVPAPCKSIC